MKMGIVRRSLMNRFVRENIALNVLTRERFINRHVSGVVHMLCNDNPIDPKVIVVVEG